MISHTEPSPHPIPKEQTKFVITGGVEGGLEESGQKVQTFQLPGQTRAVMDDVMTSGHCSTIRVQVGIPPERSQHQENIFLLYLCEVMNGNLTYCGDRFIGYVSLHTVHFHLIQ